MKKIATYCVLRPTRNPVGLLLESSCSLPVCERTSFTMYVERQGWLSLIWFWRKQEPEVLLYLSFRVTAGDSPKPMSSSAYCKLSFLLLIIFSSAFAPPVNYIPPLRTVSESSGQHSGHTANYGFRSNDVLHTFSYNQTLHHFSFRPESYTTFRQRYAINFIY